MWRSNLLETSRVALPSLGTPPHPADFYFTGVTAVSATMFAALVLLVVVTYLVLIKHDNNLAQLVGYLLIIFWFSVFGPQGTEALQGIELGVIKWGWAALTG